MGRAPLLPQLMVEASATYAQFERLARTCGRPGFEFVPASRYSPSVVTEVVASDEARPGSNTIARYREMLADLDSAQFSRREAAANELIRGGRSTLWFLDHASQPDLSAEQRQRIRSVRTALVGFSQPDLPFEFSLEQLRELTDSPPTDWLSHLRNSPTPRISDWARHKLPESESESAGATSTSASTIEPDGRMDRCVSENDPAADEVPQ